MFFSKKSPVVPASDIKLPLLKTKSIKSYAPASGPSVAQVTHNEHKHEQWKTELKEMTVEIEQMNKDLNSFMSRVKP